jgi:hypothetical protein
MWVLASQDMFVVQVPSKRPPADCAQSSAGTQATARHTNLFVLMDNLQCKQDMTSGTGVDKSFFVKFPDR